MPHAASLQRFAALPNRRFSASLRHAQKRRFGSVAKRTSVGGPRTDRLDISHAARLQRFAALPNRASLRLLYVRIHLSLSIYIYIYILLGVDSVTGFSARWLARCAPARVHLKKSHTGVCESNTHLDGAGVLNVPTPLPLFQSWRKDTQQQLTKQRAYFIDRLHSPCACPCMNIDIRGYGGSPTLTTSRTNDFFTDTGM